MAVQPVQCPHCGGLATLTHITTATRKLALVWLTRAPDGTLAATPDAYWTEAFACTRCGYISLFIDPGAGPRT